MTLHIIFCHSWLDCHFVPMLSPHVSVLFDQVKLKRRVIGNEQTKVASPKPADMETQISKLRRANSI